MTGILLIAGLMGVAKTEAPNLVLTVDTLVVGSRRNGVWKPAGPEFASQFPRLALRSFGVGNVGRNIVRTTAAFEEVDSANYLSGMENPSTAFLHGGTPRVPRPVETLDRTGSTYKKIVSDFLARKGVVNPKVSIQKLIRVDLDGNGTKEVLIEARNRDDFNLSQMKSDLTDRDYSLVLLRSVRGKGVFEFPLEFVSKRSDVPMDIRRLRGVADIDGDGRMEIVTDSRGYEWQHGSLWKYGKGVAKKVVTQYGGH